MTTDLHLDQRLINTSIHPHEDIFSFTSSISENEILLSVKVPVCKSHVSANVQFWLIPIHNDRFLKLPLMSVCTLSYNSRNFNCLDRR